MKLPRDVQRAFPLNAVDIPHREDFQTCPHCDATFDPVEWKEKACLLVLDVHQCKHGSLTVISTCPKCRLQSWVHHSFDMFGPYGDMPQEWNKPAEEERKRRHVFALRAWAKGICHKCRHLCDGHVDTNAWRVCRRGVGGPVLKCDAFDSV